MAQSKKIVEPPQGALAEQSTDTQVDIKPVQEPVVAQESEQKKAFRAFMEKVKAQHPYKYPLLEAELINKLNSL